MKSDWMVIGMAKLPNYYKVNIDGLKVKLEPIYEELVEVVRCKDCEHYTEQKNNAYNGHFCEKIIEFVQPTDFCSRGERKSE